MMERGNKEILSTDGLVTGYGKMEILHGVSLSVQSGEIVAPIGPNGSGKSTVLKASIGISNVTFPELAFTQFYPQQPAIGDIFKLAEPIPGPTTNLFSELAKKFQVVVVLNLFEKIPSSFM